MTDYNGHVRVHVGGLHTRELKAGADGPSPHLYVVRWEQIKFGREDATPPGCLLAFMEQSGPRFAKPSCGMFASTITTTVLLPIRDQTGRSTLKALAVLEIALALLQTTFAGTQPLGIWLLTGSVPVMTTTEAVHPQHAGLWGLFRSAMQENPLAQILCAETSSGSPLPELWLAVGEPESVLRGNVMYGPRLTSPPQTFRGPVQIQLLARGAIGNLEARAQLLLFAERSDGQTDVGVRAVGLNFRDVRV